MTNTVKLQGIYTRQKAIEARELKAGMVTVWNYGYKEIVKSVEFSKSGKTLTAVIVSESGKEFTRKLKATRLVAIA